MKLIDFEKMNLYGVMFFFFLSALNIISQFISETKTMYTQKHFIKTI